MLKGDRVRGLAEAKGWSLEQLRTQAQKYRPGLAWSTLSKVVNQVQTPTNDVVVALARALGTSTDYLLGRSDDPNPTNAVPAMPVPAPDIAQMVGALNASHPSVRAGVVRIVDVVLELVNENVPKDASGVREMLSRLHAGFSPSDRELLRQQFEDLERMAEHARISGSSNG